MDRRSFLKSGLGGGLACSLGGYSLFPSEVHAKIPANLKVTALKVIPVWTGSMNYIFVKLFTNAGITGVGEGGIR
ncbi:MAG: twin-arginine translocation signal domain-containing protein, partial [Planctomycetaceae bacterium]|nr:twin-arginine translocation signal domain-containing protein [Planctomycetaceae bacterium]